MTGNNRDRLRRLASFFEAEVSRSRAEQLAAAAMLRARPVAQKRWALVAIPSAAALIAGLIGVGAVSDDAVPGQVLYPLDRAYESVAAFVGVDTGPGEERLVEALALIDQGRDLDAVRLVDEALSVMGRETGVTDWEPPPAIDPVQPPTTAPPAAVSPPTTAPAAVTPTVDPGPTIVAVEAPDASHSLRLATEYLLQSVRDVKKPKDPIQAEDAAVTLRAAASGAVAAGESVKAVAAQTVAAEEGSTTTTTVPGGSTTTTTVPGGSTTTTTVPGGSTTTTTVPGGSTTTTTVPGGSTTTTTLPDGPPPGPIILPPQP